MKDYLCIGQILNLKKYDTKSIKLRDFENKEFFIISAKSIKSKDKDGFYLTIEDTECNKHIVTTYSAVLKQQITDLLCNVTNENGVFEKAIKCKLQIIPIKTKSGDYHERFKLV